MSGIIGHAGSKSGVIGRSSNEPAFSASSGSVTACASGSATHITFSDETYDEGGCYNNTAGTVTLNGISTPAYAFAPNVAGKYQITCRQALPDLLDGKTFVIYIYKNGTAPNTTSGALVWQQTGGTQNILLPVMSDLEANGTSDYFQIFLYHNHGSSRDSSTGVGWSQFSAFRITG